MTDQPVGTPRPTGDAAWKAHLDDVQRRNDEARKTAAGLRSVADVAAIARANRLKGD